MLDAPAVEITYGLERILMSLQGVKHFKDIRCLWFVWGAGAAAHWPPSSSSISMDVNGATAVVSGS